MKYVIGIDSGGSKTRALAADLGGKPVGYVETLGGNPFHNPDFKGALGGAIEAVARGIGIENVVQVVCGIAGLDGPEDDWAEGATQVEGLSANRLHLNDTEIAHFAAFQGAPGVVSIQGHGSNIFGITESGERIRNANFLQYASAGAVAIGMKFHHALLWGGRSSDEGDLVAETCGHWNVSSAGELYDLARRGWDRSPDQARNHMGAFASKITAAAANGSASATEICRNAAYSIAEGIGLVGQTFDRPNVSVALVGSAVRSAFIQSSVRAFLLQIPDREFELFEPEMTPLTGAVLMALQLQGVEISAIDSCRLDQFQVPG